MLHEMAGRRNIRWLQRQHRTTGIKGQDLDDLDTRIDWYPVYYEIRRIIPTVDRMANQKLNRGTGTETSRLSDPNVSGERVLVTGIGVVLPGTQTVSEFWQNISGGRSQIGPLTRFDPEQAGMPVYAAAEIDGFDHHAFLPGLADQHAAKYSREILIAMSAAAEARKDAGLSAGDLDPQRVGIVMSSSRGPFAWWRDVMSGADAAPFGDKGAMFRGLPGSPASLSAIYLDAQGLITTLSNACVGGHQAIGVALRELRAGTADVMFVGGHEFPIAPEVAACYRAAGNGVLSTERAAPARAVRPYNDDREGFALGEGAVVLCLERASSAASRGAAGYAEVLAAASLNEAGHPTTMDLSGKVTASLIGRVLTAAGRQPDDVDYFCAHGTATRYNDLAESRALRTLYPGRTPGQLPPLSSNKPIYGHTFGLAGIINAAATSLMIRHQTIAPTINLTSPDPECDHDHVAEGSRTAEVELAVSLSFAFGSQTAVIALGAPA
jgi:3-oxoacyl-[acyl-carrier-protein] synthase II